MKRNRPVSLALVGLTLWATACITYTRIELDEVANHDEIHVRLENGETKDLYNPTVEADALQGRTKEVPSYTIPLDLVSEVGVQTSSTPKTIVAVTIGTVAAAIFVGMMVWKNSCAGGSAGSFC